jgi:hypothetical protein
MNAMSIAITIVTTANRTLHFKQSDPTHVDEILSSLRRCNNLFTNRTLVVVSDTGTEVFSPRSITRIEIQTDADLSPYLPAAWEVSATAMGPGEAPPATKLDDDHVAAKIDFFFEGGDSLSTWFERKRPSGIAERAMQITRLFEQAIIPYHLGKPGIGFMNPGTMTRASLGISLDDAPAGAWQVKSA